MNCSAHTSVRSSPLVSQWQQAINEHLSSFKDRLVVMADAGIATTADMHHSTQAVLAEMNKTLWSVAPQMFPQKHQQAESKL